jgi:dUTP pyrophosphatase
MQENLKVKIKKMHPDAVVPKYAKPGDAGLDLTATSYEYVGGRHVYGTGLAFEIPRGYVGLIFPRSSICKKNLALTNAVGVLDSDYRGEVKAFFSQIEEYGYLYNVGDRIAQIIIVPYPQVEFQLADELSGTERGSGGFGSTGV